MNNINELGNGVGLLYVKDLSGDLVIPGIPNTPSNVRTIKQHALVSSPVGYTISAKGSIEFTNIGIHDIITDFQINAVTQFDIHTPISIEVGFETTAALNLANAINSYIPNTGVNYTAIAIGKKVYFQAPSSAGGDVNGDVVAITVGLPALQTITIENINDGSTGEGLKSTITGYSYFLNATTDAIVGSTVEPGIEEISKYIINRGTHQQIPLLSQQIASTSVVNVDRFSQIQVLELGASGITDLDNITGDFAIHDILIIKNMSAFAITVNDLSINTGNIKINPTTFSMVNDNYIMWLMYVEDPTDGLVWQEICRVPRTVDANSITDVELANLSVGTSELKDLNVTTAKIALLAITNSLMAVNSVGTLEIIDLNVTTAKIDDLAITSAKLALLAVGTAQLADLAITSVKIASNAVSLDKLSTDLQTEIVTAFCSFETGYKGQVKIEVPYACNVIKVSAAVIKAIEATDDATIIPKNHAGTAMTTGQIDLTAAAPVGNVFTSSPSGNNSLAANENIILELSKITDGGVALVTLHIIRI